MTTTLREQGRADTGAIRRDGWLVTWDHTAPGQLTWEVRQEVPDEFGDVILVARYDDGWRIARKGFTTVDHEVMLRYLARTQLVEEEGWRELLALLNEIAGKEDA
jgi:hypothetical protein